MVDNGKKILGDQAIEVAADDTGAELPLKISASGAIRAPDTALHW